MSLDFNEASDQKDITNLPKLSTDEVRDKLLGQLEQALHYLFPAGVISGNYFEVGDINGTKGKSLKVTLKGKERGLWHDFATNEGGDIITLWGNAYQLDHKSQFPDIISSIHHWLGIDQVKHKPKPVTQNLGVYSKKWDYLDTNGNLIACVYRYDTNNGKEFRPWDVKQQKTKAPNPRPLYNQQNVAKSDTIILVEGEKCADALINIGFCATTAMMGANAPIDKTDWSLLKDKNIIIWPDNDEAGHKYAKGVANHLQAKNISIIFTSNDKPPKWDAADAIEDDIDIQQFIKDNTKALSNSKIEAYSVGHYFDDKSPMPDDIIAPRILTPGGLLVFGGAPKIGKSDFLIHLLMHMAAGEPFLNMYPKKPLKIFYLQAEIGYHYLRERLKSVSISQDFMSQVRENLIVTPQIKIILNEAGISAIADTIQQSFKDPPDIICIDPLRNIFDGGENGSSENDNAAMLTFLHGRIDRLREIVNPNAGIIIAHHTKKMDKKSFAEDPFQALSGASALRGYYTTGMLMHKADETNSERNLYFELRNGPSPATKLIDKEDGKWIDINIMNQRLTGITQGEKHDAERDRRRDIILQYIADEARQGNLLTLNEFTEKYENKGGLGSASSIRDRLSVLSTKNYIKFTRDVSHWGLSMQRQKYGYLVVENMHYVDFDGVVHKIIPTHIKCPNTGRLLENNSHENWVLYDPAQET